MDEKEKEQRSAGTADSRRKPSRNRRPGAKKQPRSADNPSRKAEPVEAAQNRPAKRAGEKPQNKQTKKPAMEQSQKADTREYSASPKKGNGARPSHQGQRFGDNKPGNKGGRSVQQKQNKRRRTGPPTIHDGYDDIRSYGGRYLEIPDYDDSRSFGWQEQELLQFVNTGSTGEGMSEFIEDVSEEDGEHAHVAGRNAVRELLRSDRSIDKIFVKSGPREGSLVAIVGEARHQGIPVIEVAQEKLDQLAQGAHHQGVVAMAAEKQYTDIDGILAIAAERGETPLVVIADSIEDPHNLGALIRCAECAGAHGIIIPKRRSAGLTPVVAKASAGAIAHMAVAKVPNISQAVAELKKKGLWIFVSEAGGTPYYETDFKVPAGIIFGSEGAGVAKTVRDKCDFVVSIPMYGKVNSLNVSTAASVILCHAARMQRTN